MKSKKSLSIKAVVLLMVLVLLIGCGVGGTLAYLMATTKSVTNTFVVGQIGDLTLKENGKEAANNNEKFTIVPGKDLDKKVTVSYSYTDDSTDKLDDVPVYVFVKIGAPGWSVTNNRNYCVGTDLVTWAVDDEWEYLASENENERVYYCTVEADASLDDVSVIENGKITVSSNIERDDINTVVAGVGDITFTAYAIQKEGFDTNPSAAWAQAKTATTNSAT